MRCGASLGWPGHATHLECLVSRWGAAARCPRRLALCFVCCTCLPFDLSCSCFIPHPWRPPSAVYHRPPGHAGVTTKPLPPPSARASSARLACIPICGLQRAPRIPIHKFGPMSARSCPKSTHVGPSNDQILHDVGQIWPEIKNVGRTLCLRSGGIRATCGGTMTTLER